MERRRFLGGVGTGVVIVAAGCTSSSGDDGDGDDGGRRRSVVVVESFFEAVDSGDIEEARGYIHPDSSYSVDEQHSVTVREVEHRTVGEFVDETGEKEEGEDREQSIQYVNGQLSDLADEVGYEETDLVYFSITDHTGDQDKDYDGHLVVGKTDDGWLIWNEL